MRPVAWPPKGVDGIKGEQANGSTTFISNARSKLSKGNKNNNTSNNEALCAL